MQRTRRTQRREHGFTLLEMVIVVAVVAVVAGTVILSAEGARDDSSQKLARSEMLALKKALLQFRADVGYLPDAVAPLLESPGEPAWDADRRRGWRGPYITRESQGALAVNDPWGRPYQVFGPADLQGARIVSLGASLDRADDDLELRVLE